ncbi:hypothetical protein DFH07DRAFT_782614 [Mycena maculata]|uniref:Uncharacterized protein n=1 Tax=Mycena maculata TaxID=230809 RepID=A0AAD7HRQ5_9AGAR|nr:hypothetical protein DFH07DRAFT_782614 [Mycena maculata]
MVPEAAQAVLAPCFYWPIQSPNRFTFPSGAWTNASAGIFDRGCFELAADARRKNWTPKTAEAVNTPASIIYPAQDQVHRRVGHRLWQWNGGRDCLQVVNAGLAWGEEREDSPSTRTAGSTEYCLGHARYNGVNRKRRLGEFRVWWRRPSVNRGDVRASVRPGCRAMRRADATVEQGKRRVLQWVQDVFPWPLDPDIGGRITDSGSGPRNEPRSIPGRLGVLMVWGHLSVKGAGKAPRGKRRRGCPQTSYAVARPPADCGRRFMPCAAPAGLPLHPEMVVDSLCRKSGGMTGHERDVFTPTRVPAPSFPPVAWWFKERGHPEFSTHTISIISGPYAISGLQAHSPPTTSTFFEFYSVHLDSGAARAR